MSLISLTINNKKVDVEKGSTILDACKKVDVNVPTLCYMRLQDGKTENCPGSCRVCLVEVQGRRNLAPACSTPAADGMVVNTNSIRAVKARRTVVELLLSDHPKDCLLCEKNTQCELQKLAADMGLREIKYNGEISTYIKDNSSKSIVRDMDKCILCRRCETVCSKIQTVSVLSAQERGFVTVEGPAFDLPLTETNCTFCGQCVAVCPTGALAEVNNTSNVWDVLSDTDKFVVVQTAPAVRAALGEEFGLEPGTPVTGKLAASLRALGFNKVFDTDFAADLTIMEEAAELINRIKNNGKLPLLTSCCPGWINFLETQFGDDLDMPSTCKSPQQMFGAITKTYLAEKMNIAPEKIVVVSVMPCIAKKSEASREELSNNGVQDVDIVISTRELAKMIKEAGINFKELEDENFDEPLGASTGASVIFGATGGVMEAALRTAYEWVTGKGLENVNFENVRGFEGIKEAVVDLDGMPLKIAIASGLGNARKLLNSVKEGKAEYHMIEVMACPGGCLNGGGQPYIHGKLDILSHRASALYQEDSNKTIRKSHENPFIVKLYEEYLEKPNSEKAHHILHTTYKKR